MRDAADLQIVEAIIHVLDPRGTQGIILSSATIPLTSAPIIGQYLTGHISRSLRDSTARAARFIATGSDTLFEVCSDMFSGGVSFIEGSQQIATRLANQINADRRIAGGDLVICQFTAGNHLGVPAYIGLLKLDPSEVFRHKQEYDANGNGYITLEIANDALPTAGERLQKCAFVRPLHPRTDGFDLMLLDRQVGTGDERQVAQFFVNGFLGAHLAFGPSEQTDRFYRTVVKVLNIARSEGTLNNTEFESVRASLDTSLETPSINTTEWVAGLPGSQGLRRSLNEALAISLPDPVVEVDAAKASRYVTKRRFRGSHGLYITVEADHYADVIVSAERSSRGDGNSQWRIVLETDAWEEVTR